MVPAKLREAIPVTPATDRNPPSPPQPPQSWKAFLAGLDSLRPSVAIPIRPSIDDVTELQKVLLQEARFAFSKGRTPKLVMPHIPLGQPPLVQLHSFWEGVVAAKALGRALIPPLFQGEPLKSPDKSFKGLLRAEMVFDPLTLPRFVPFYSLPWFYFVTKGKPARTWDFSVPKGPSCDKVARSVPLNPLETIRFPRDEPGPFSRQFKQTLRNEEPASLVLSCFHASFLPPPLSPASPSNSTFFGKLLYEASRDVRFNPELAAHLFSSVDLLRGSSFALLSLYSHQQQDIKNLKPDCLNHLKQKKRGEAAALPETWYIAGPDPSQVGRAKKKLKEAGKKTASWKDVAAEVEGGMFKFIEKWEEEQQKHPFGPRGKTPVPVLPSASSSPSSPLSIRKRSDMEPSSGSKKEKEGEEEKKKRRRKEENPPSKLDTDPEEGLFKVLFEQIAAAQGEAFVFLDDDHEWNHLARFHRESPANSDLVEPLSFRAFHCFT